MNGSIRASVDDARDGATTGLGAQTGQQRGQNEPRWNIGRCLFSDRPPHIKQALVTAGDWMHGSMGVQ